METLKITLSNCHYQILIGNGIRSNIGKLLTDLDYDHSKNTVYIVSDGHVADLYLRDVIDSLSKSGYRSEYTVIPPGESSKSLAVYETVITEAIRTGMDRQTIVIALGGGVVGDLAGFVAATYMRGVPFIQMPTTLQAHDSSVGGKVGINLQSGKNLLGAFYQPQAVIYDTETLSTLPSRELYSGFAEIIKEAWIDDALFVEWLETNSESLLFQDESRLTEAIIRGCSVKARIVALDEKEQNIRAYLNFGHTVGHALEKVTNYKRFTHGEAISIGLIAACMISEKIYKVDSLTSTMKHLLTLFHLPTTIPIDINVMDVVDTMKKDKKSKQNKIVMILTKQIGAVHIEEDISIRLIKEVLQDMIDKKDVIR